MVKQPLQSKLFIGSALTTIIGVIGYVVGLNMTNPHIVAFSTEVGGAGLAGVIISLIR